jgi:hypothetical protein
VITFVIPGPLTGPIGIRLGSALSVAQKFADIASQKLAILNLFFADCVEAFLQSLPVRHLRLDQIVTLFSVTEHALTRFEFISIFGGFRLAADPIDQPTNTFVQALQRNQLRFLTLQWL